MAAMTHPLSILDTDLYKLTMQAAVRQHYPDAQVSYNFTNRGKTRFSPACVTAFREGVYLGTGLAEAQLQPDEHTWLTQQCPYFPADYLDYLATFRFKPREHVRIEHNEDSGDLSIVIAGPWVETILYEVPLLALLSEAYFTVDDTKWDMRGQRENAYRKGKYLLENGCAFSEFGTRRRRSYEAHEIVMQGLVQASKDFPDAPGKLSGTSNVHFAHKFGVAPVGTVAHEWIMGTAAIGGYEGSNGRAMEKWEQTYHGLQLTIALTDTFSTGPFWKDFAAVPERAARWNGVRQDSGDPFAFAVAARGAYAALGIDPSKKTIIFSDGLDPERCVQLKQKCKDVGIGCGFGIGTNLSNDFKVADPVEAQAPGERGDGEPREGQPSKALNIVIKLATINGEPCVKISDVLDKNTGNKDAIAAVKHVFHLDELEAKGLSSFGDV